MSMPPSGRPDDEVRDLLPAYALDAVDDLERRAVERLLAAAPDARAELATLRETVAHLADDVTSPAPAGMRAEVLAAAARTPQDHPQDDPLRENGSFAGRAAPPVAGPVGAARSARRPGPARWLAVAAAAVAVAVPSGVAWQQHERAETAQAQADALAAVLADPTALVLRGEVTGGGDATAVLSDTGAVLLTAGLAPLPADRTYQLWAMRDGVPVPAGLLGGDGGAVRALAEDYRPGDGLALSVEPDGGSQQPTTEPVLVLLPG